MGMARSSATTTRKHDCRATKVCWIASEEGEETSDGAEVKCMVAGTTCSTIFGGGAQRNLLPVCSSVARRSGAFWPCGKTKNMIV
jgi:hypothetical protein